MACNIFDSLDHVEVKCFDETSTYQDSIGDEEWFSRYEFLYDGRRIKVNYLLLVHSLRIHVCSAYSPR